MFMRQSFIFRKLVNSQGKLPKLIHNLKPNHFVFHSEFQYIHTSSIVGVGIHIGNESRAAHDYLKRTRDRYVLAGESVCEVDLELNKFVEILNPSSVLTIPEIIESFQVLSDYAHSESIDISSNIFDKFVDILTDSFKNMSSEQLCEVFKHLRKWPAVESPKTRNLIEIWTALDDVLKNRCESWNLHELLLFLDHIFRSSLLKNFLFSKYAISKLIRKSSQLTPAQLVQVAFYAGNHRWKYDMFDLEVRFYDCIDFLTVNEIGIVCMGLFKTQSPIRDPHLLLTIMKRLRTDTLPDNILMTSILKMIKYSIHDESNPQLKELFDWFVPHVDSISTMACTHLASAGVTTRFKHVELLEKIALRLSTSAHEMRLKDLERMAHTFSVFNMALVKDIPVFEIIIEELRNPNRLREIEGFSFSFVNCLMYLVTVNRFPLDLITYALSDEFMEKHYKYLIVNGKSMHIVSNAMAIECKKLYKGPYLNEKYQKQLSRKYVRYLPEKGNKYKLNTEQANMLDIMNTIANHRGDWKYVKGMHLLPHFDKGDIILCNGVSGNPVRVENYFPKKEFGQIYYAPDRKKTWVVVVATGPLSNVWDTSEPTGSVLMKMRQLKALGYTPVHLPMMKWEKIQNPSEKVDYLKNLFKTIDFDF